MYLLDTSVWIDFFRKGDDPWRVELRHLLSTEPNAVGVCMPVRMELRLGSDDLARRRIEKALDRMVPIPLDEGADFELAADIYRAVQKDGHTIRSSVDCLIAAIAVRHGAELIHKDVDFERIAAVVPDLIHRSLR